LSFEIRGEGTLPTL